jgi:putative tricarboxylic transport membrane protein
MSKTHQFSADRLTAVVLLALGAAVTYGGWSMDRLEIRRIHPASIPGLLPFILGVALMICAAVLYSQAKLKNDQKKNSGHGIGRFVLILVPALVYAIGLVGTIPFWLATLIFVSFFICVFEWPAMPTRKNLTFLLAIAVAEGTFVAVGVTLLFEKAFLVRLP